MNISEIAVDAAQNSMGGDLAAGVGNDEDQRTTIRIALEAAAPFIAAQALRDAAAESTLSGISRWLRGLSEELMHSAS